MFLVKIADNIHALCSTVQSIQYSVRKEADAKQDPLALLISCSHWYCVLGQSKFSIEFVSNAYKCVGQLAYVFNVLSVCYISIILNMLWESEITDKHICLLKPWLIWYFHGYCSWNWNDFSLRENTLVNMSGKVVTGYIKVY